MDQLTSGRQLYINSGRTDFLGQGRFGEVWRCYSFSRNELNAVAVKLVRICGSSEEINETYQSIESEVNILKAMDRSPYIVNLFGVVNLENQIGIVMEYMSSGNLTDFIKKRIVPLVLRLQMLYETAAGLSHLHSATFDKRVSHNDLKPDNILLDDNLRVKICDFGGSDFISHTSGSVNRLCSVSHVRTTNYAAPEVLSGKYDRRTKAMDVYSYAMVTFFFLASEHPFHRYSSSEVTSLYTDGKRPPLPNSKDLPYDIAKIENQKIYDTLVQIMNDCWNIDPDERPAIRDVKEDLKIYLEKESSRIDVEIDMKVLKQKTSVSNDVVLGNNYITLEQKFFCSPGDERDVHSSDKAMERKAMIDSENGSRSPTPKLTDKNFMSVLKPGDKFQMSTPVGVYMCHVERTVTGVDGTILDKEGHKKDLKN